MKKYSLTLPKNEWGTLNTKYPSSSTNVDVDDFTGTSNNFDTDDKGVITKRPGGVNYKVNLGEVVSDLYEAVFTDGVHHLLACGGGKVRYSPGDGTFTQAQNGSGFSETSNWEFALFGDRVYMGNMVDSPQVYDRVESYGDVDYSAPRVSEMGATPPESAVSGSQGSAGNIGAGTYTYKITYLYYGAEESNGGPASSGVVIAANKQIELTSLPVGGYGVTARKIYRENGDGVYRLVGTVENNTDTTYTDDTAIGGALVPTDNGIPPKFGYVVLHLDHLFVAGVLSDPSTLYFSSAGLPNIYPSNNYLLCNPKDPISWLVVFNDRIIVFNKLSMGQILGRTPDTFRYSEIQGSVGCIDGRSVQVRTIEGIPTLIWLSDKGFYSYNGSSIDYISDTIQDSVNLAIQQVSSVKGQNTQTKRSDFEAGTASPSIDLATNPGYISVTTPKKTWTTEAEWESVSAFQSNLDTTKAPGSIQAPVRADFGGYSEGTFSNLVLSGTHLELETSSDFTGESTTSAGYKYKGIGSWGAVAQPFIPQTNGVLTRIRFNIVANASYPSQTLQVTVWENDTSQGTDNPGNVIYSSGVSVVGGNGYNIDKSPNLVLTAGVKYWYGCRGAQISAVEKGTTALSGGSATRESGTTTPTPAMWSDYGNNAVSLYPGYEFTSSPVSKTGTWTSPIYDCGSIGGAIATLAVNHDGSYPAGTSGTTTLQGSDSEVFATIDNSESFNNVNGQQNYTLAGNRYWRVVINLSTDDDRITPYAVDNLLLLFNTTAYWISEAVDHTTDITDLSSLDYVGTTPSGTSVTLQIATSDDNITYSSYTSLGSATAKRYSKVKVIVTSDTNNSVTATVQSVTLKWAVSGTLESSVINCLSVPAGWDIFSSDYTLNGGTVSFEMRSADTPEDISSADYVAVTNGTFPSVDVFQYVQWKVTITANATSIPLVDSVVVQWFISSGSSIRVASLFYNKRYYLSAAEYNQTANNVVFVLDQKAKWRIYRGISVGTISLFFNNPYYGDGDADNIVRFLHGTTDQGTDIALDIQTKGLDFNAPDRFKTFRKVYVVGKNTGAELTVQFSTDNGVTWNNLLTSTGATSYQTTTDGSIFIAKLVPSFAYELQGRYIKLRVTNEDEFGVEIHQLIPHVWVREGDVRE